MVSATMGAQASTKGAVGAATPSDPAGTPPAIKPNRKSRQMAKDTPNRERLTTETDIDPDCMTTSCFG